MTVDDMDLRNWFAGMALQGLLAGRVQSGDVPLACMADISFRAFQIADAMIANTDYYKNAKAKLEALDRMGMGGRRNE